MDNQKGVPKEKQEAMGTPPISSTDQKPWEEPKLTKHGDLEKVTGGLIPISPHDDLD